MRLLITGAGGGIGAAVARLAAERAPDGNKVLLTLVDKDEDALAAIAQELVGLGAGYVTVAADLSDPAAPEAIVARAVDEFGGLDALISNAGVAAGAPLDSLDVDAYDLTFAVNTRATWLLAKAAYPALRESHGAIVATASISAEHPTPPLGAYSASKAAVLMLIRQLALEWGKDGIRANCVSPGPTDTGLTRRSFGASADEAARANRRYRESLIPLRRIGHPSQVAEAVLFLASSAASQITGVDLPVDGGLSLAIMPVAAGIPGYAPAITTA